MWCCAAARAVRVRAVRASKGTEEKAVLAGGRSLCWRSLGGGSFDATKLRVGARVCV